MKAPLNPESTEKMPNLRGPDIDSLLIDMRSSIRMLSYLTPEQLTKAGVEIQIYYEHFLYDNQALAFENDYSRFVEMVKRWYPIPDDDAESDLFGLTIAQYFYAWAWHLLDYAEVHLARFADWDILIQAEEVRHALTSLVRGASALGHANALSNMDHPQPVDEVVRDIH